MSSKLMYFEHVVSKFTVFFFSVNTHLLKVLSWSSFVKASVLNPIPWCMILQIDVFSLNYS